MAVDQQRVSTLRANLSNSKVQILTRVQAGKRKLRDIQAQRGDLADMSQDTNDQDLITAVLQRALNELVQIERAISRLDSGSYGICDECGEEISERRLNEKPFAQYCINCQEMIDERESKITKIRR